MQKTDLVAIYSELRKHLNLSLMAIGLLATCPDLSCLTNCVITLGKFPIPLGYCAEQLCPTGAIPPQDVISNSLVLLVRTIFKESYAALRIYGEETDQWHGKLERQDWYQYLRLMRNSMEHSSLLDPRFDFCENDIKNNLPLVWNGKRLDVAMNGQPIDFDFFSPLDVIDLLAEAEDYILNHMT